MRARLVLVLAALIPGLAFGGSSDGGTLSLAVAQPLNPSRITATGRAAPLSSARLGSRLSGHIVAWGRNSDGRPLEVGDFVKAGQEIFRLDPTTYEDHARAAEAALKLAQAQLADLKSWEREERRESLRATLAEYDARLAENKRDEERFRRLVEQDKTMPVKRLEEIQLQRQVLEAQRRAAQARLNEALAGPTPTQLAVAEAQVNQAVVRLESARLDLKDLALKAPFDGVIARRFKGLGDYVANAPFIEVLELVSVDRLEAELRLPERYYGQVSAGKTEVTLRSPLLPEELRLPIARVIPDIDPAQGTFAFRVALPPERRGGVTPGAFLQGELELSGVDEGAVLPAGAVVERDGRTRVFVAEGGRVRMREVELGSRLSEGVIVRRGVRAGEKVVLSAGRELQDGQELPAELNKP